MNLCCVDSGPDDIPKSGNPEVFGQILFAKDNVEYHGQPVGLIVAKSQVINCFDMHLDVLHSALNLYSFTLTMHTFISYFYSYV